jgi:hypothetical protein
MAKFNTFVTTNATLIGLGQEWTLLKYVTDAEYYWKAPGLSTTEEIYLNVRVYKNVPSDNYGWRINSGTGFITGNSFWMQPNAQVEEYTPYLPLWINSIPYWFVANGQRAIIAAKVGATYQHAYFGKINQFASPTQWPYPVFIGSMTNNETRRYSTTDDIYFRAPACGNSAGGSLMDMSGVWQLLNYALSSGNYFAVLPYVQYINKSSLGLAYGYNTERYIMPITLFATNGYTSAGQYPCGIYGEYDGLFAINGTGLASESTFDIDSVTYVAFQSGSSSNQTLYHAVRLA